MVIILKVSDILVWLAVLDVVIVVLKVEFFYYYFAEVLEFEYVGAFPIFAVALKNPLFFLFGESIGSILIQPSLVIIQNIETVYHFFLKV